MSDQITRELLLQVRRVYRQVVPDFMTRRNVVACGVGYKTAGGRPVDVPRLIVSVVKKEPPHMLSPDDLIPKFVEDVQTGVDETGPITADGLNRCALLRPTRPGMSVGHPDGNVGTIGAVVRRGNEYFILSNNHVLALLNTASLGDPILQPAPGDGGTIADTIGQLADFVPIRFMGSGTPVGEALESQEAQGCAVQIMTLLSTVAHRARNLGRVTATQPVSTDSLQNRVDAALARVPDKSLLNPAIIDIGGPPRGITEPELGMPVVKSGRTSGLTEGQVRQIDVTVNVRYGERQARYVNQIMVSPFSQPGDSGSLVLDYERQAVGLLFAGSEHVTVVSPIELVLAALNVELVAEESVESAGT